MQHSYAWLQDRASCTVVSATRATTRIGSVTKRQIGDGPKISRSNTLKLTFPRATNAEVGSEPDATPECTEDEPKPNSPLHLPLSSLHLAHHIDSAAAAAAASSPPTWTGSCCDHLNPRPDSCGNAPLTRPTINTHARTPGSARLPLPRLLSPTMSIDTPAKRPRNSDASPRSHKRVARKPSPRNNASHSAMHSLSKTASTSPSSSSASHAAKPTWIRSTGPLKISSQPPRHPPAWLPLLLPPAHM